jgi:hypothetical protein
MVRAQDWAFYPTLSESLHQGGAAMSGAGIPVFEGHPHTVLGGGLKTSMSSLGTGYVVGASPNSSSVVEAATRAVDAGVPAGDLSRTGYGQTSASRADNVSRLMRV